MTMYKKSKNNLIKYIKSNIDWLKMTYLKYD